MTISAGPALQQYDSRGGSAVLELVHAAFPRLSCSGHVVLTEFVRAGDQLGSPDSFARRVGLRSRFQLSRLFRREGLPPFEQLANWCRVMTWVERAERTGVSLCRQATDVGADPAAWYRVVRTVTGLPWRTVRQHGCAWLVLQLGEQLPRAVRTLAMLIPLPFSLVVTSVLSA